MLRQASVNPRQEMEPILPMMKNHLIKLLFLSLLVLLAAGCGSANPPAPANSEPVATTAAPAPTGTDTPEPSTPTATEMDTATATLTVTSPASATRRPGATPTATLPASDTPTITPTATLTATQTAGAALPNTVVNAVNIYLIRQQTNGPICGDSAIAVGSGIKRSGDIARDVEAALHQLLSLDGVKIGDLYNPLGASDLKVTDVFFGDDSGLITVQIRGTYRQPKDPCDNTRVRAQVWSTVKQFEEITATNIYLNGVPFGDKLSNGK